MKNIFKFAKFTAQFLFGHTVPWFRPAYVVQNNPIINPAFDVWTYIISGKWMVRYHTKRDGLPGGGQPGQDVQVKCNAIILI